MIPAELIKIKRNGNRVSKNDLKSFVDGYAKGRVPDYQMSAFLMAVFFSGMEDDELFSLVEVMIQSGEKMHFSHLDNYVADKHSTGGVGDKVSIILGPLLAAAGLSIPMLSGRSLGHTGGTLDKLETIPGYRTNISLDEFKRIVETVGISMIGQTDDICPADKKMYGLRDVTGTVESIPLICGSIMSKKIAEGIQGLVLDVKTGNGAFMKTPDQARALGTMLQKVGTAFSVKTDVVYSSMDQPLGKTAGLWCEVAESIDALKGNGVEDLMAITYELGAKLLVQAGITRSETGAIGIQENLISSGHAFEKFLDMVSAQGGKKEDMAKYQSLHSPKYEKTLRAEKDGIIQSMDTYSIGLATLELGCGRKSVTDSVDPTAGIEFLNKIGDEVKSGDSLFRCFNSDELKLDSALNYLRTTAQIGPDLAQHSLFIS